ncbi:hypothetical protein Syun_017562 [Stephania yunnanensis]|uniref:RRP12-like protein n=1 Tax=Stephania yunnanensis TaxID=152371 RepID=A0AAP0J835_9MAGN
MPNHWANQLVGDQIGKLKWQNRVFNTPMRFVALCTAVDFSIFLIETLPGGEKNATSNEEARKAAYDVLMRISSSLKNASSIDSDSPRHKLYNMIMGYLSGTPPHIMTGAVSALSLLVYKDNAILFSIPELVPSVLVLLQSKAKEIIKVVLGFVKVLVSCLQANDLQKILPDIVNGILPWSSVSRNHFRSKVTVVFEIIIRKCGAASVLSLAPEKYKGFIKAVFEQRHGKISLKDVNSTDMPIKRSHKRKHKEMSHSGEVTGFKTKPNKIRRVHMGKKREFNASSANKFHHNDGIHRESRRERRSKRTQAAFMTDDGGKQAGWDLNKRFKAGREKAIGWRKESKRDEPTSHMPTLTSKFHKRSKKAARSQRTKK